MPQQYAPAAPALPAGWTVAQDPASGRAYYVHALSCTTQWEPPMATVPPPPVGGYGMPGYMEVHMQAGAQGDVQGGMQGAAESSDPNEAMEPLLRSSPAAEDDEAQAGAQPAASPDGSYPGPENDGGDWPGSS